MDTEAGNTQAQLLEHAARQTKALENINWVLMALFVLVLISAGVFMVGLFSG